MAPIKAVRTYGKNKKKIPASGHALNTLLALNLRKRLESTNDTSGSDKEKSTETTFDRLLKGEFYNDVQFKKFPENNSTVNEDSNVSIVSGSNNTCENSYEQAKESSVTTFTSVCSPIVILERNLEYVNQESQDEHQQYDDSIDNIRNELEFQNKLDLMNSLGLSTNDSFYGNFENAVDKISTPHVPSYRLRKQKSRLLSTFPSSSFIDKTKSISHENLETESEPTKKFKLQKNTSVPINISTSRRKSISEEFIEASPTPSTPERQWSSQDISSSCLLNKSYGIINEWSNRCPSPSSFNDSKNKSVDRKYSFKRRKESKLFRKTQVILKHIPQLEDIIKDISKCSTPVNLKFFNVKRISNAFVTRRKPISKKDELPSFKTSVVDLSSLHESKLKTSLDGSEFIDKLASTNESLNISYPEQNKSLEKQKLSEPKTPLLSPNEVGIRVLMSSKKHKCSLECEHFRKIPKVTLERKILSKNKFTKKSANLNKFKHSTNSQLFDNSPKVMLEKRLLSNYGSSISNSPIDFTNSVLVDNSPINFKGFSTGTSYNIDEPESCVDNKVKKNYALKQKSQANSQLTKENVEIKDCFVILERMKDVRLSDKNELNSVKDGNTPKKQMKECWVIMNENKHEIENCSSEEGDALEETNLIPKRTEFVCLEPGKKFRRSVAIFKQSLEDHINNSETTNPASRITIYRRQSVKVIPVAPCETDQSELANFAHNVSGYVSRESIRRSSLEKVEKYFPNVRPVDNYLISPTKNTAVQLTAREIVLKRCGQTKPLNFEECYPRSALQHCQKIGEGVFGEVFMKRDKEGSTTVMKVIPIEGNQIVNLEKQKTFGEILSEIIISMELSNLRMAKRNNTDAFVKMKKIHCVQGCYPDRLLELWELYDENKNSENDSPEIFLADQLYIVLELANAGQDLEAFQFNNAQQALSVFEQVTCALAVAESELHFEHRDLHWGNVLVTPTTESNTVFVLDGEEIIIKNKGVKATIIDFTLSRVECDGVIIFNDISKDEDLFTAKGDYQFDIYRKMRENNRNYWQNFNAYSNILWLHYILCKALNGFRYKNLRSKQHKSSLEILKNFEKTILDFDSSSNFVKHNFCNLISLD